MTIGPDTTFNAILVPPGQVKDVVREMERFLQLRPEADPSARQILEEFLLPALREIEEDGDALIGYVG